MKGQRFVPQYGAMRDPRAKDPARGYFTPKASKKNDPRAKRKRAGRS